MSMRLSKISIITVTVIACGILARLYMAYAVKPIAGDNAVFAIMGQHIAELKEFPIYMPMAHYAGALPAYIAAGLFAMFGASYNSYIAVGFFCACAWIFIGYMLNHTILNSPAALIADALTAVPAFTVLFYALYTGVHAENLFFIPALILPAVLINRGKYPLLPVPVMAVGLLSGLALWTSPSTIPAIGTLLIILVMTGKREHFFTGIAMPFILGLLLGYAPAIIYNIQHPGATFFRMAGRVLDLDTRALSDPNLSGLIAHKLWWRVSTVPSSLINIGRLTAQLLSWPVALIFFVSAAVSFGQSLRTWVADKQIDDMGVVGIYIVSFIIFYTALIGEDAVRYMVPLYIAVPIVIGYALTRCCRHIPAFAIFIAGVILLYNSSTIARAETPFRVTRYDALADWLVKNNITGGYSDYETSYVAQFLTDGRTLISPTLFHPTFADRWPDQTKAVQGAPEVCYIIDGKLYPEFMRIFEKGVSAVRQKYVKDQIGDFTVYRGISAVLKPDDIVRDISGKGAQ